MHAGRLARTVVLILIVIYSSSLLAQTPTFQFLINPAVAPTWVNYALSKDGKVMAANYGGRIYRWSADTPKFPSGGFTLLDPGYFLSSSVDISEDGTTIVASRPGPDGNINPAIWSQSTGWTDMGHPTNGCILDGEWGSGYSVSGDGARAVGLAWYCPGAEGFVWNRTTGMKALSHPNRASSRASAISADGLTIVGFFEDPRYGNRRPVRWVSGKTQLFAGANTPGEATSVSSDGSKIVGQAFFQYSSYAFYYTQPGGLASLGTVSGNQFDQSVANAVADNGTTVGWSGDPFSGGIQAFIWRPGMKKMQPLRKYLQNRGVLIPSGIYLTTALDISADASTIVGVWQDTNFNQGGWMVRLKP